MTSTHIAPVKRAKPLSHDAGWGYLMVAPTILGLIILNIYPFFHSIYMSFSETMLFGNWEWVGLDNYRKMFSDPNMWRATGNTLYFVLLTVPLGIFLALAFASMLNSQIKGRDGLRAIYFLPMIVAPAAIAMVWKWLYNTEYGLINQFLGLFGADVKINWISNPKLALPAAAIVAIWSSIGYDIILLLAGLQAIPRSYYEAADIDGANFISKFFHITVPMVSPTMFFVLIMRLMAALKQFDLVYMMITDTNPAFQQSQTLMYLFYRESFQVGNKGYASALVLWTFVIILAFTAIQFVGQKKWVHYDQ